MSAITQPRLLTGAAALPNRRHRFLVTVAASLAIAGILALTLYGFDYYGLNAVQRPLSPKHKILRPTGTLSLKLGQLSALMFVAIYLYPLRKRWEWLRRQGNSRHWLDFHVLLGLVAPITVAFHSSFKFQGIAGMAFWSMMAVSISGIVGRYLYSQIPRSITATELSLQETEQAYAKSQQQLAGQKGLNPQTLQSLLHLPEKERVGRMGPLRALVAMMWLDALHFARAAHLRRQALHGVDLFLTCGGLLSSRVHAVEQALLVARRHAALSKKMLFLSRAHRVFQLWHVIHRPFSYSFAVLATLHILVALAFGVM